MTRRWWKAEWRKLAARGWGLTAIAFVDEAEFPSSQMTNRKRDAQVVAELEKVGWVYPPTNRGGEEALETRAL